MKKNRFFSGFTLIELLVSAVVISVLGSAAWYSAMVLMQANEVTSNNIVAVNLLRKSQEEVRRVAQSNFDNLGLGTCNFSAGNTCGFEDITVSFPGYTRTLTVTASGATTELKQAVITLNWTELGRARNLRSAILLSRPPRSLPGNIIGRVTDSATGNKISGVSIVASKASPPMTVPTTSQAADLPRTDGKSVNFTFVNATNQYQMDAGSWSLTAAAAGYKPFTYPGLIEIESNTEEQVNFAMEAAPRNAKITVSLVKGGLAVSYVPNISVGLYKAGVVVSQNNVSGTYTFPDITFTDTVAQCFTIATNNAYRSGFAGNFSCNPPRIQDPLGWSSSVVQADNSLTCSQPRIGNSTPGVDRICVNPGDNVTVAIPIVPVATATVSGYVRDQNNNPIAGADVFVGWHDTGNYPWPNKSAAIKADANGFYTAVVPAEQAMFPNIAGNYIKMGATTNVSIIQCCNIQGTVTVASAVSTVGPLFAGDSRTNDLVISTVPQNVNCGDAQGTVRDGSTGSGLPSAVVTLATAANSSGSGAYQFLCAPTGPGKYSIPTNNYTLTAAKPNYYSFTSAGNNYYARFGTGVINVAPGVLNTVGTFDLWPQGFGVVRVNVVRQGSGSSVTGAAVSLSGPAALNMPSDAGGLALFSTVLESWPVPAVVGNLKYNQTIMSYTLTVTHPAYENFAQAGIKVDKGNTVTITATLIPKGGM